MISRLLILLLVSVSSVAAQQSAPSPTPAAGAVPAQTKATYETLLEKVKKSDPAIDFQALRLAYTETKAYGPYGGDAETRKTMFAALRANEYHNTLGVATCDVNRS